MRAHADERAEERLLDALLPGQPTLAAVPVPEAGRRAKLRRMLQRGLLDEREIEVELADGEALPSVSLFTPQGMEKWASSSRICSAA